MLHDVLCRVGGDDIPLMLLLLLLDRCWGFAHGARRALERSPHPIVVKVTTCVCGTRVRCLSAETLIAPPRATAEESRMFGYSQRRGFEPCRHTVK